MISEAEAIKGLKAGNEGAYGYLYKHQYKALCMVACEYVSDTLIAEMIVSDVIFAIWQNRESLEINTSLRGYLIKSVRNRCFNYIAQTKREHTLRQHIGIRIETVQSDYENNHNNPLRQLIEKELDTRIDECINVLPEQTRLIFCLSRFNGLKYEEIARTMGVSVDVVKYHIKSALSLLRTGLKDYLYALLVLYISADILIFVLNFYIF